MKRAGLSAVLLTWALLCTAAADRGEDEMDGPYTVNTKISDVMSDPVFGSWGRLIFPVDEGLWSGETLGDLRLTWYSNIDPDKTVEICSYLHEKSAAGETMQRRLEAMSALGIPTEFHVYEGLSHGFGLGAGTVAEGWINDAVSFWKEQMKTD